MGVEEPAWGVLNMSKTWRNNQISHELYLPAASLIILPDWLGNLWGFKYSLSIYIHATHLHAIELKTGKGLLLPWKPVRIGWQVTGLAVLGRGEGVVVAWEYVFCCHSYSKKLWFSWNNQASKLMEVRPQRMFANLP